MFCCKSFEMLAGEAGQKGFAIMAARGRDARHFCLEFRSFDADVVRKYAVVDPTTGRPKWPELSNEEGVDIRYPTSSIMYLQHCPACGADLSVIIARDPAGFDALAEKQRTANPDFRLYDRMYG